MVVRERRRGSNETEVGGNEPVGCSRAIGVSNEGVLPDVQLFRNREEPARSEVRILGDLGGAFPSQCHRTVDVSDRVAPLKCQIAAGGVDNPQKMAVKNGLQVRMKHIEPAVLVEFLDDVE